MANEKNRKKQNYCSCEAPLLNNTQTTEVQGFRAFSGNTMQFTSSIEKFLIDIIEKYYFSASAKYIEYNQAPGANLPVS